MLIQIELKNERILKQLEGMNARQDVLVHLKDGRSFDGVVLNQKHLLNSVVSHENLIDRIVKIKENAHD